MAALMRCNLLRQRNLGQLVIRVLSSLNNPRLGIPKTPRFSIRDAQDKHTILYQLNRKLDNNIGVSQDQFKLFYSFCEKEDSFSEQDVAMLLHICSMGPFDTPSDKRSKTADEIWSKLDQLGVSPSIRLYNIKLKVFAANRTPFNPLDELVKLKALGLNPDKVTYGLLVEGFCQQGNIEGANNVLETMKVAGYLLGISNFNSYITGHLKAGSPEEAVNVLEIMRTRSLEPNSDTFLRFALHYADQGDDESVMKYIQMAEDAEVLLSHSAVLEIYRAMVRSGHSDKLGELLNLLEKGVYHSSSMQKSCQLISEGFNEAALRLYEIMPKSKDEKLNTGSFLLKTMIINGQNAESIMEMADKIVMSNVKALPHRISLLYAYTFNQTDLAVEILEMMKAKNHEIKVPYIVPAIYSYWKAKNKEALHKVVHMLLELDGEDCLEDKLEVLLKGVYPALSALKESREDIVENFKDFEKTWNCIFFISDLTKDHSNALKNVAGKMLETSFFRCNDFQFYLFSQVSPEENASLVNVLEYIKEQGIHSTKLLSLTGEAVLNLSRTRDWELIDKTITALQEKNLKVRSTLKQFAFYREAPEALKTKIDAICHKEIFTSHTNPGHHYLTMKQLDAMTIEELERHQMEFPSQKLTQIAFLNKILETNDLNNIKQKLQELNDHDFKLSLTTLMRVMNSLTKLGDLETALQYFDELKLTVGNKYYKHLPLAIGVEFVKAGNISGALQMIQAAAESTLLTDERMEIHKRLLLRDILKFASTIDDAYKLHTAILQSPSLAEDNTALQIHAAYIQRVIENDNDSELLDRLTKVYEEYKMLPCLERILVRLIEKQDVTLLKKVMELGIKAFGTNNFHIKMALSFIECGMPSKAVTVLQTKGLKIHERSLILGCQHFVKTKKIRSLELLFTITKDMPVSRTLMLKFLLEGYVAVEDLNKATEVLDQFAGNIITPPKETVDLLVKAYLRKNLAIPESLQSFTSGISNVVQASTSSSESDSDSSASEKEQVNSPAEKKDSTSKQKEEEKPEELDTKPSASPNLGSEAKA